MIKKAIKCCSSMCHHNGNRVIRRADLFFADTSVVLCTRFGVTVLSADKNIFYCNQNPPEWEVFSCDFLLNKILIAATASQNSIKLEEHLLLY